MECRQVQEHLSEYMDRMLDARLQEAVAAHLRECVRCRTELEEMQAIRKELLELPRLSAPDGFLDAVHGMTEREPWWTRYGWRIFMPWQIKIPLELAGVVASALFILFLYQTTQFQMNRSPASKPESIERSASSDLSEAPRDKEVLSPSPAHKRAKAASVPETRVMSAPAAPPKPVPTSPRTSISPAPEAASKPVQTALRSTWIQATPTLHFRLDPFPSPRSHDQELRTGPAPNRSHDQMMLPQKRGLLSRKAKIPEEELEGSPKKSTAQVLGAAPAPEPVKTGPQPAPATESAKPITKTADAIHRIIERAGGEVVGTTRAQPPHGHPTVITCRIPADNLNHLKAELQRLGDLHSRPEDASPLAGAAIIRIQIEIAEP